MDALLVGTLTTSTLTLFGVAGMIYYTRKNLKTAKYIDTITTHSIKKTDAIRNEVADITTDIDFSLNAMSKEIDDKTSEYRDVSNDPEYLCKRNWAPYTVYTSLAFNAENTKLSIRDLIFKFYLLKLRLNTYENKEIADLIDYFIVFYTDEEQKFNSDILEAKEKVTILMAKFEILLKCEWEKVKNESYGKI